MKIERTLLILILIVSFLTGCIKDVGCVEVIAADGTISVGQKIYYSGSYCVRLYTANREMTARICGNYTLRSCK